LPWENFIKKNYKVALTSAAFALSLFVSDDFGQGLSGGVFTATADAVTVIVINNRHRHYPMRHVGMGLSKSLGWGSLGLVLASIWKMLADIVPGPLSGDRSHAILRPM
jgi:hypothetical protein